MSKTVTCLYQDQQKASEIVSRLEQAGISRGDISFYSTPSDNLIDDLENDGVPRTDAHAYAEGVRRGGSLVAVECDDDEVDQVIDILDDDGVLDLDEQETSWRSEGWQGYDASTSGGTTGGSAAAAAGLAGRPDAGLPSATVPRPDRQGGRERTRRGHPDCRGGTACRQARGRPRPGAHPVPRGRAPGEEQVNLREEHVRGGAPPRVRHDTGRHA